MADAPQYADDPAVPLERAAPPPSHALRGTPEHEVVIVSGRLNLPRRKLQLFGEQVRQALGRDTPVVRLEPELSRQTGTDFAVVVDPREGRSPQAAAPDIMARLEASGALETLREANLHSIDERGHPLVSGGKAVVAFDDPHIITSPKVAAVLDRTFGTPGAADPARGPGGGRGGGNARY